ncbi:MAG: hypothetical protein JWN01_164 [Patescibacteria group bacterium]|nr:hypothetical protein [Patescibacteria group bacterium]
MRTIWTIGHSVRSAEEVLERLQSYGIDRLVDVRTKPYSRWHPHFNRDRLAQFLADHDINYDWRGANLGGLGENVEYEETLAAVYELAAAERIVLLCSEAAPEKCHRLTVLTPALEQLGAAVEHIRYEVGHQPRLGL